MTFDKKSISIQMPHCSLLVLHSLPTSANTVRTGGGGILFDTQVRLFVELPFLYFDCLSFSHWELPHSGLNLTL